MTARICSIEEPDALEQALDRLRAGEPIAFPTDTVYGVGAAGRDAQAEDVAAEFVRRRRPRHDIAWAGSWYGWRNLIQDALYANELEWLVDTCRPDRCGE